MRQFLASCAISRWEARSRASDILSPVSLGSGGSCSCQGDSSRASHSNRVANVGVATTHTVTGLLTFLASFCSYSVFYGQRLQRQLPGFYLPHCGRGSSFLTDCVYQFLGVIPRGLLSHPIEPPLPALPTSS